jgi:hypothetical protein
VSFAVARLLRLAPHALLKADPPRMRSLIPAPVLSVCADVAAKRETHASLDSLFTYAGAPGDPPPGSKPAKAQAWLRATNKDKSTNPLDVLGRLIENYMEAPVDSEDLGQENLKDRERIDSLPEN